MKKLLITIFVLFAIVLSANQANISKGQFNAQPEIQRYKRNNSISRDRTFDISFEDFENGNNWNYSGGWEIGTPSAGTNSSYDSDNCAGTNLDGFYQNECCWILQTEVIDLPAASNVTLSFQEWFSIESGYDHGFVLISTNGGASWTEIDERSGTSDGEWSNCEIDITSYNSREIVVAFKLLSDASVPGFGWYIDNFSITGEDPNMLDVSLFGLQSQNFPFINMNAIIDSFGTPISSLDEDDFTIYENGVEQTDFVEIIPPESEGRNRMADIVFVLDVSGSMGDEINAVRDNMQSFVNSLTQSQIDFKIGFIVFADIYYVYNEYNLYSDADNIISVINNIELGEHGLGGGGDFPENQFGAMAEACLMNYRPGSQRIQIMLTDATSHESDNVTPWTLDNLLAERLIPNQIIVFPIFNNNDQNQINQYVPIAEMTNPQGVYYHIYDNFNEIITDIGNFVGNNYSVRYKSNDEEMNGLTRITEVVVDMDNESATGTGFYMPGSNPVISLTDYTASQMENPQLESTDFTIAINIEDQIPPYPSSVNLFYKQSAAESYLITQFEETGQGTWEATIPAVQMQFPGLSYYISASDGQTISTYPSLDPISNFYSIAVGANEPPQIEHEIITSFTPNSAIAISAEIADDSDNISSASLYFRRYGELSYQSVEMSSSNNTFSGNIPATFASNMGIAYYIVARDNHDIASCHGNVDEPHLVILDEQFTNSPNELMQPVIKIDCFPNPFSAQNQRGAVNIKFNLQSSQKIRLDVYNIKGQLINTVANNRFEKGDNLITWDTRTISGKSLSSGIYFIKLESPSQVVTSKVTVIK